MSGYYDSLGRCMKTVLLTTLNFSPGDLCAGLCLIKHSSADFINDGGDDAKGYEKVWNRGDVRIDSQERYGIEVVLG